MARATWSGAISFGLVNVPIKLYGATHDRQVHFHQFDAHSGQRIRLRRVAEASGKEVAYEDIVKGFEVSKGEYVTVTPEELEAVEPGQTKTIDIEDFIDLDAIDPVYFDKSYYIGPGEGPGATRAYALLREAMRSTARIAVGRFVMRTKQHLAAVRPRQRLLVLETMFFPGEITAVDEVEGVDELPPDANGRELQMAEDLVSALTRDWDPRRYHDEYRERVLDLIDRKSHGEHISTRAPAPPSNVVDLMSALAASVKSARRGRRRDTADLSGWTKQRLYDEAARRGVAGRSRMTKEQLVEALQEAS